LVKIRVFPVGAGRNVFIQKRRENYLAMRREMFSLGTVERNVPFFRDEQFS
jgi:hypothetical protein